MSMQIRAVRPEDGLTWERMRYALWPGDDETHGEVVTDFFNGVEIADPADVLLAEEAGTAVGFVELSIRTDLPSMEGVRVGYVEGLYVEPGVRFQGVARALLAASRAWSQAQGCTAFASDRDDRVIVDRSYRAVPL